MQIVEHTPKRLVIRDRTSLWCGVLGGIAFISSGLFLFILSLAIYKTSSLDLQNFAILPAGMGIIFLTAGCYFSLKLPGITTVTFDKNQELFSLKRQVFCPSLEVDSIALPLALILGIEVKTIESHSADTHDTYQIALILDSSYCRIPLHLNSDSCWQQKTIIAKTIADFLNISYFTGKQKAPTAKFGDRSCAQIQAQIEQLQMMLNQHPHAPEADRDLGLLLYRQDSHKNRQQAIAHLQQAEIAWESQSNLKELQAVRAIKTLMVWQQPL
jgi:hypothetical protein